MRDAEKRQHLTFFNSTFHIPHSQFRIQEPLSSACRGEAARRRRVIGQQPIEKIRPGVKTQIREKIMDSN